MNDNPPSVSIPQPWEKVFSIAARVLVWGILFAVLYLLRSFFPLIFLIFVFSYVLSNGVNRFEAYFKNRIFRVILVTSVFLSVIIALSLFLAPRVAMQTRGFVNQFPSYLCAIDQQWLMFSSKYSSLMELLPLKHLQKNGGGAGENKNGTIKESCQVEDLRKWKMENSPTVSIISQLLGLGEEVSGQKFLRLLLDNVAKTATTLATGIVSIMATFLLALLFSFLIVLDLPKLSASVRELENTKIRFVYVEVADSIYSFCSVLGQAFEAQFVIAVVNSILTALGVVYILDLGEHVAFLSVIVFLMSFIPVAGVFISSVPICLIALQSSGFQLMLLAILMIMVIHAIEAYILNPEIYGHRLRINPVIVLIILTIGGKLFYFWGLILGVPLFTYFFGHAIRFKKTEDL